MMEIVQTIGLCAWFVLLGMSIGIEIARRRDANLIANAIELRSAFRKIDERRKMVGPGVRTIAHLEAVGARGKYLVTIEKEDA